MSRIQLPIVLILLSGYSLLCATPVHADLSLDMGFGTDGVATIDVAPTPEAARVIATQADGKLVLAGISRQASGGDSIDYVALARIDSNTGAPDAGFGTGGILTFLPGLAATNGGGGDGRAVAIQPADQKIIVAGTWRPDRTTDTSIFVARVDTGGALDPGFGTSGVTFISGLGVTNAVANAVGILSDGTIIVAGSATQGNDSVGIVVSLNASGVATSAFAPAIIANPLGSGGADFGFNAMSILSGDRVLVAGGGGDLTLAQFTANGSPDTNFNGSGIAAFNYLTLDTISGPVPSFDVIKALTVLNDGRILVAGHVSEDATLAATNRILARITANGSLDTSFGSGGFRALEKVATTEIPTGLAVRSSGDIVMVGQGFDPTQISPNGIAASSVPVSSSTFLFTVTVLADDSAVAVGEQGLSAVNSSLAAVRLAASDLPDGPDIVPDPFAFLFQGDVTPGQSITSNTITITGLNAAAPISIFQGSEYSIGCSVFTVDPGVINNGDTVCVRTTAVAQDQTTVHVPLTIGTVIGVFSYATTATMIPDPFTFTPLTDVAVNTIVYANPVTITGITAPSTVSISSNGQYQIDCTGNWTSSPGLVTNSQTICIRQYTAGSLSTATDTVLTVGGTSGTFTTTTTAKESVPGGSSSMDVFSLLLLTPLLWRRRRPVT